MHILGYQCVFVLYIHLNMHLNLYSIKYLPSLAIIAKSFNDIVFLLVFILCLLLVNIIYIYITYFLMEELNLIIFLFIYIYVLSRFYYIFFIFTLFIYNLSFDNILTILNFYMSDFRLCGW